MFRLLLLFISLFNLALQSDEGISYRTFEENKATIHVLEVDPEKFDIVSARPDKAIWEDVKVIDNAHPDSIAAVNAGFYIPEGEFVGFPLGALKINQQWICTSKNVRGTLGWSNESGKVLIDEVCTKTTLKVSGLDYEIDGVNLIRKSNEATIYNSFFLEKTHTTDGREFLIEKGIFTQSKSNNSVIPQNGFVLSIGPGSPLFLNPLVGSRVSYRVDVLPQALTPSTTTQEWEEVEFIVGGFGILIKNGQLHDFTFDNIPDTIVKKKHPRTAVGILENGHWLLVVVDGRRNVPGRPLHKSVGISLPRLALLMQDLGCVQAVNLDGGGSTTMVFHHEVVNEPCGYDLLDRSVKLRKVSDVILVIPKEKVQKDNDIQHKHGIRAAA